MKMIGILFLLLFITQGMAVTCPDGYMGINYGSEIAILPECTDGTDDMGDVLVTCDASALNCFPDYGCGAGLGRINTSSGVSVPLYSQKISSPSINIMYEDSVCYVQMVPGQGDSTINMLYENEQYYATSLKICRVAFDADVVPTASTGASNEVVWNATVDGVSVMGISYCGNSAPTSDNYTIDMVPNSSTDLTANIYCYCRIVTPFPSLWYYTDLYKTNGATACNTYCASACGSKFKTSSQMRTRLYNSMK